MLSALQEENAYLADELKGLEELAKTEQDFADILHQLVIVLDPIKETLPRNVQRWIEIYHNYVQEITEEPFDKTN